MKGLPGNLYREIRTGLMDCGPFNSQSDLQPYFNDERLFAWRNNIPNGPNKQALADALITFLYNKPFDQPNPLVRFLRILSEWAQGGCQQELSRLADAVAAHLGEEQQPDSTPVVPAGTETTPAAVSKKDIFDALLSAYPNQGDLKIMVAFELEENLNEIAGGGNLQDTIFELIKWAEAKGRLNELVQKAHNHNAGNPKLAAVAQKIQSA